MEVPSGPNTNGFDPVYDWLPVFPTSLWSRITEHASSFDIINSSASPASEYTTWSSWTFNNSPFLHLPSRKIHTGPHNSSQVAAMPQTRPQAQDRRQDCHTGHRAKFFIWNLSPRGYKSMRQSTKDSYLRLQTRWDVLQLTHITVIDPKT